VIQATSFEYGDSSPETPQSITVAASLQIHLPIMPVFPWRIEIVPRPGYEPVPWLVPADGGPRRVATQQEIDAWSAFGSLGNMLALSERQTKEIETILDQTRSQVLQMKVENHRLGLQVSEGQAEITRLKEQASTPPTTKKK
jgi:hypothetical protein